MSLRMSNPPMMAVPQVGANRPEPYTDSCNNLLQAIQQNIYIQYAALGMELKNVSSDSKKNVSLEVWNICVNLNNNKQHQATKPDLCLCL